MNKLDSILYEFLVEESNMPINEFRILTESDKGELLNTITSDVLSRIKEKMIKLEANLDLFAINKTRGEVKNYQDLNVVQDSINKLSNLIQANLENLNPLLPQYLKEIIQSIFYLNKYSYLFKEAYRNKKTLLILRYQSIILSIISAISYLISVSVDFKDANQLKLKNKISIEEISPIKSLIDFNRSVENGTFDASARDTSTLREFFNEYSVEEQSTIYEAVDIVSLINNGIDSFSDFMNNGKRNTIIFKVLGIITLILSLRQAFYSLANSKNKMSDYINNLKNFLNIDKLPSLSSLSRFITFNNKNVIDAETSTKTAEKEIKDENKQIIQDVKIRPNDLSQLDYVPSQDNDTAEENQSTEGNIFADFNF